MAIVTLLEHHDRGLEALGEDLSKILEENSMENIYKGAALHDYLTMSELELEYSFERDQIEEELSWLIEEIKFIQEKYKKELQSKPRAIFFELPNTIVFEFLEADKIQRPLIRLRKNLPCLRI